MLDFLVRPAGRKPRRLAIAPSTKKTKPKAPPRAAAKPAPRKAPAAAPAPARKRRRAEQPLGVGVGDAFAVERLGVPVGGGSGGGVRELTWVEFGAIARDLTSRIAQKFQVDVILGVARGGIFVGGAMAAPMRAEFLPVRVEKRSRDRSGPPTVRVPEAKGRNVLVVDDVTSSGATLEKAKALARRSGAREIHSAALVVRPGGARPDWFALETAQLIVFPWDYQLDATGPAVDPGDVGV